MSDLKAYLPRVVWIGEISPAVVFRLVDTGLVESDQSPWFTLEKKGSDALGQDTWSPVKDGTLIRRVMNIALRDGTLEIDRLRETLRNLPPPPAPLPPIVPAPLPPGFKKRSK